MTKTVAPWAVSIPTTDATAAAPAPERVRPRWVLPNPAPEAADLAAALGLSLPIATILARRGLTDPVAARTFLAPPLEALHPPEQLLDMDRAAARLLAAVRSREKIRIQGDYDVDGITSTVILKTAIEMAGGDVSYAIPHRLKDGYGISAAAVDRAAEDGVRLLVSVDCGIRAAEVVRRATELSIDVIITDHHLPDAEIPAALAVINPNRPGCMYPNKHLCGVGVTFKLVEALLGALGWEESKLRRMLASFLKLVAIGTVADVVPLTGENRVIVRHGLAGLRNVRNIGLQALLATANIDAGRVPSAREIAFRIAPRINAAGRMASASDAVDLFFVTDPERARAIAAQLNELNAARQAEEAAIVDEILAACLQNPMDDRCFALVFHDESWHRGVLGIVASRLVDRFHRPAFVLGGENGEAQGSGRSIRGFHLLDALDAMPGLFRKYGGHSHAAGVTLPASSVAEFRERFNAHAAGLLALDHLRPSLAIDAVAHLSELNDKLYCDLQSLEPFGAGNEAPVFAAMDVEVAAAPSFMKEKHIRVALRDGARTVFFKGFHLADRAGELAPGARIDVAFSIEEDRYRESWGTTIRDFRMAGRQGLEPR